MKVSELIQQLQQFPGDMEVSITDGYEHKVYGGDFTVNEFVDCDGRMVVDIGIGGMEVNGY